LVVHVYRRKSVPTPFRVSVLDNRFVQSGRVNPPHRPGLAVRGVDDPGPLRVGQEGPHGDRPAAIRFNFVGT
jgi:hypothetical protein